ncbi:MAG: GntR family transcriptional regulator [Actinobacteria bacterium]|uniref:GntR family transcriptional regulator n=1 Tax=Microbacterium sp. TaxID=51671 RepID=UPI000C5F5B0A|nr:GntR family transcriptional regulator [Microbacterium sp.]MBU19348.1 GntR family transcriptional regulator [Microbacterium sp.]RUA27810.1 MAG: GntR family transcriptional regulator [Actinomycetota bacterium]HIE61389.1 GntR family transcriptional regulator [Microbacterium sp.]|tara:strand:- start:1841 stop:2488 length:648 start_codon:yes stop_codon:yes gene_type:complete
MTTMSVEGAPGADVTGQIRDAIQTGRYAPHQRLIESDISAQFGASRAAVRNALLTLTGEGLVERMPNKGARVRSFTVDEAIEIAEVRMGLEALCARKAADLATDDEIAQLQRLRADMVAAAESGNHLTYAELKSAVHQSVQQMSRHNTAVALLERLRAQSARHQFRLALHPGRGVDSVHEHAAIIDAVVARDPDASEAAMRHHLAGVIEVLRTLD